jgi:hypothetical protein
MKPKSKDYKKLIYFYISTFILCNIALVISIFTTFKVDSEMLIMSILLCFVAPTQYNAYTYAKTQYKKLNN